MENSNDDSSPVNPSAKPLRTKVTTATRDSSGRFSSRASVTPAEAVGPSTLLEHRRAQHRELHDRHRESEQDIRAEYRRKQAEQARIKPPRAF